MGAIESHLPEIWLFIIGFFLLYYAINDGADLGVGIISLATPDERERSIMMGSIGSIWADNQTWLVLLGGMLFGAFPIFYSVILPALYIPVLLMLFGLGFRGVAFVFRANSRHPAIWSRCFGVGSLIITLAQGFALGGLLSGLDVQQDVFRGSVTGWINPFTFLIALGVLCGYVMLGANYLIFKTVGPVQARGYRYSLIASLLTLGVSLLVHVFIDARYPQIVRKLTTPPDIYYVPVVMVLAAFCFVMLFVSLLRKRELAPLLWNAGIVLFPFIGLSLGMYPDMIPNVISSPVTVHAAAASKDTLEFMLEAMAVTLPVILIYTIYKHWVFRGKTVEASYHGEGE
ncbi:MAG: cytochrome d ubiquinol oxidase subunit II [Syntrophobacteraceae bacterium]